MIEVTFEEFRGLPQRLRDELSTVAYDQDWDSTQCMTVGSICRWRIANKEIPFRLNVQGEIDKTCGAYAGLHMELHGQLIKQQPKATYSEQLKQAKQLLDKYLPEALVALISADIDPATSPSRSYVLTAKPSYSTANLA